MKLSGFLILVITLLLLSSCSADALPEDTEGDGFVPTVSTPSEGDGESEEDTDDIDMNKETENRADGFVMRARVDALGDVIAVTVIDAPHGNTGVFWVLTSASTEVTDADGAPLSVSDVNPGDTVKITYSGQVMLSYPPRITAQKIEIEK